MDDSEARSRLTAARVATLATVRVDGSPHLVPITFAIDGDLLVTAIDHKPKTSSRLRRLANIRANPAVSVLIHGYDEEWSSLWWVRVDGTARILEAGADYQSALTALAEKYRQYRDDLPSGPAIEITVNTVVAWSAAGR
jgi:PPOX class probable F420-dependent enzyme